ncbi:hypothetical protein K1T71_009057 [Dendrolimus kikuchii]|uniref:Uncharacterized protein n=1 Tax=Dendrolimus kikuchii TaxID=765133 RepID=A0ACC1CTC8_9NEOP|nr:hypothetical protein K1T71_009057 [Dendrolimus kikuchii]
MEAEIADLRSELRSLQAEVTRPRAPVVQPDPPPPNMETALAANLERMTLAMESRFAAMEEQLRSARLAPSPAPALSPAPQARPTSLPTSPSLLPGLSVEEYPPLPQRGRKERAVAKSTPPPPDCPAPLPSSATAEQGWTTVGRKKRAKKAPPSSGTQPATTAAAAQPISAPRRGGRGRGGKGQGDRKPRDPLRAGYPSPGPHRRGRPCLRGGQPLAGRSLCSVRQIDAWRRSWRTCAANWRASGRSSPRLAPGQSVPRHHPRQSPHHRRRRPQTWTRGRGRPPTTGEYVGLAKAKQALVEAHRAEVEVMSEKDILERAQSMACTRARRFRTGTAPSSQAPPEARAEHAQGLKAQISDSLAVVAGVAKVSKGLKGTLQKALKEAAAAMQEASEELLDRTATQEVALLRAANSRMEAEIADLRQELVSIRSELTMPRPAPPPQQTPPRVEPQAANLNSILLLIENRFAALEERVRPVQPALSPRPAFSTRPTPPPFALRTPPTPATLAGSPAKEFPPLVPSPRRSTETAVEVASAPLPLPRTSLAPPATSVAEEGWSTVARRKPKKAAPAQVTQARPAKKAGKEAQQEQQKKKKRGGKGRKRQGDTATTQPPPPPPPPPPAKPEAGKKATRKAPRLRPPRSSAVVLTLLPGAGDRGVSYESLLATAKANIKLADLGIEGGVRIKTARTGARMLILPGADSAPKADALAERLRGVLNAEDVKISRPERTVSLRVSGLDDYTTPEEVAAAIAQVAGCPAEQIRPNAIRTGPDGLGSTTVACPIVVAKKLEGTKLLVGWASAIVKPLPPRAPRCFRCLELHHVAAKCTSEVDRSKLCYRCGQSGHLVTGPCTAAPHCSVCEAAGRPANHQLGGGPCRQQPTRRKSKKDNAATGKPAQTQPQPQEPQGEVGVTPINGPHP